MSSPQTKRTSDDWLTRPIGIVFSDIVGSTVLLFREGTMNYSLILRSHRARAASLAATLSGRLVEHRGDELFAAFKTASNAVRFAQQLFIDPGDSRIAVRIGVHYGTVQPNENGLIGRDVHVGARVLAHGRDHELWVSESAKHAIESESTLLASTIEWITNEECELKGVPNKLCLWRAA